MAQAHRLAQPAENPKPRPPEVQAYFDVLAEGLGQHPYATLLGIKTYDTTGLHERVKEGLSFTALERLRKTLDMSAVTVGEVLHISPRTFQRRKETGRLMPDESDRLIRLSRLFGKALELFEGDVGSTRVWLNAPLAALGGNSPLDLAQSEPGASEVETLIGRLEHGVFA